MSLAIVDGTIPIPCLPQKAMNPVPLCSLNRVEIIMCEYKTRFYLTTAVKCNSCCCFAAQYVEL